MLRALVLLLVPSALRRCRTKPLPIPSKRGGACIQGRGPAPLGAGELVTPAEIATIKTTTKTTTKAA